jgi:hypothetical protein
VLSCVHVKNIYPESAELRTRSGGKIFQLAKLERKFFQGEAQRKTRNSAFSWQRITINTSMRIKEILENYVNNSAMGAGKERVQDQRIMEKPRTRKPSRERKLKDHVGSIMSIGYQSGGGGWGNSRI